MLRPNVFLRDWRIVKRFVSRQCGIGIRPTKRENLLDLYQLLRWNHTYDEGHLRQALASMQEFADKIVACRGGEDLLSHITKATFHKADEQCCAAQRQ